MNQKIAPVVTLRDGVSVANSGAAAILREEHALHVAIARRGGKLMIQPIEIPGLLDIVRVLPMSQDRMAFYAGRCKGLPFGRYVAYWDDAAQALVIDTDQPVAPRKHIRG